MALVATVTGRTTFGDEHVVYGTFTNDTTSGTVTTGLSRIDYIEVSGATAHSVALGVDTVTTSATAGFFMAFGI